MQRYKLEIKLSELEEGEISPALLMEFNVASNEEAEALRKVVQCFWFDQSIIRGDGRCWMSKMTPLP